MAYELPWKRWGLQLTEAGDTIAWTDVGFVLNVPQSVRHSTFAGTERMVWGWDGHAYVGGAPTFPKEIYDYLVAVAGPPPTGHPLSGIEANNYVADIGEWANEDWMIGIFEVETRFMRWLLCAQGGRSSVLIRGQFQPGNHDVTCHADALHWRNVRMALLPMSLYGDFQLLASSVRLGAAWAAFDDPTGTYAQYQTQGRTADEERAIFEQFGAGSACDAPELAYENHVRGTPLWQKAPSSFANRPLIMEASFSWRNRPTGQAIVVDLSGNEVTEGSGMAFSHGATPFVYRGDDGPTWEVPWPYYPEGPIFTVPSDGRIAFADFIAWARSCGLDVSEESGRVDVVLWVWLGYLEDSTMAYHGKDGAYQLEVKWENGVE